MSYPVLVHPLVALGVGDLPELAYVSSYMPQHAGDSPVFCMASDNTDTALHWDQCCWRVHETMQTT